MRATRRDNRCMPIIRAGSTGVAVESLQLQLRRLGLYDGPVTGRLGNKAVKAIEAYEAANGLKVDGFVGAKEAAKIKRDSLEKGMFKGLQRGDRGERVEDIQHDLKGLGFYKGGLSGRFDAATQAAVKSFERTNRLKRAEGVADLGTETLLDKRMAGIDAAKHPNVQPPPSDYHRVVFRGGLMNVRTKVMLERAELYWSGKGTYVVTQGSYNRGGVAASAGSHDGGGALDISVSGKSQADINRMVRSLRQAGFAAWQRTPADGFSPHIHAIALGDREASPLAKQQMQSYFAGRNGLANNGPDRNGNLGRPWPRWATKFD